MEQRISIGEHISRVLGIPEKYVNVCLALFDDGATVPFIARYRKEVTGSLDEVQIENIRREKESYQALLSRKEFIIEKIDSLGALTDNLREQIHRCMDIKSLEDLYLPYKPKQRTRASLARARGLEPLAKMVMSQNLTEPETAALRFCNNKEVSSPADALAGAMDIIAEWISENRQARSFVRDEYRKNGIFRSKVVKGKEEEGSKYSDYYDYSEPLRRCRSHRFLAVARGVAEGILTSKLVIEDSVAISRLNGMFVKRSAGVKVRDILERAIADGYRRLLRPSIENEVYNDLKRRSDADAVKIFSTSLHQILMYPPMPGNRILAIDPGFRTGCKIVCLDSQGKLLHHDLIYPVAPRNDVDGARALLGKLLKKYNISLIAIGNGTAGRETYEFVKSLNLGNDIGVEIVSEQGASIYSASDVAREEFPDKDITVRGAVSIGRRLLDPLAELVKIPPQSIGVGQYQHDVNQSILKESLDFTVMSCVNQVGVDVNTASRQLLSYVAGIGDTLAGNILAYRNEHGPFKTKKELLKVPRLGPKAFQQCAGFLRIPDASDILDRTAVHPERYGLVEKMAHDTGKSLSDIIASPELLDNIDFTKYIGDDVGLPTITDIVAELKKPGRDPRISDEDVSYDLQIKNFEDLRVGQVLNGKVSNITAFGAFVDIGIKESGLLHISQMSDRYISSPYDVVSIGMTISVKVIGLDEGRRRINLSMKNSD